MFEWKNLRRTIEKIFVSSKISAEPSESRKANLLLVVLLPSCLACIGLIAVGFWVKPEPAWAFWTVMLGHLIATAGILLLKFASSTRPAAYYLAIVATLQLLSATVASGGVESNVIYAYPILPVFLASLVRVRITVLASFVLLCGVYAIFLLDPYYPGLKDLKHGVWLDFLTIVWAFASVLAVALYTRFQSDQLVARVQEELREREAAQAELEAVNQAKDRFLAYISHEIRNPLTTIVGASELLEFEEMSPESSRYLKAIKGSADSMQALVDSVLDYSQAESGGVPQRLESVAIQPILSELSAQFAGSAEAKEIALYVEVSSAAPLEVIGDPQLLKQVLSNLLGNAIKFTGRGGEVNLSVDGVSGAWPGARISVRDNGVGIPREAQERIFEPYQRHVGESQDPSGTGLGLAISYAILSNMGSELKVDSVSGSGSRFHFTLASSRSPLNSLEVRTNALAGRKFLIVGAPSEAAVLAGMLSTVGGEFAVVKNGDEALPIFEREMPDGVLFCQSSSPGGEAHLASAFRELHRNSEAREKPLRVVRLVQDSGQLGEEESEAMDGLPEKPVSLEALLRAVQSSAD